MNIFRKRADLTSVNRDYHDVATALEKLSKSGKPVTVKFENDSRTYSSTVTAFNREHRVFVLADLFPQAAMETFRKGRVATVSSTDNYKTISLKSVCLEPLVKNQNMGFEMKVSGLIDVVEFEQGYDFGLLHIGHSNAGNSVRKVVGL
jgi:hypothetical protein